MNLKRPTMFELAKEGRQMNLVLQIIIFIAIFMLGGMLESMSSLVVIIAKVVKEVAAGNKFSFDDFMAFNEQFGSSRVGLYFALFATLIMTATVIIYVKFGEKRSLASMGLTNVTKKQGLISYLVGLAVGAAMFSAVIVINIITGAMKLSLATVTGSTILFIFIFFIGFALQSASEEITMRGYLMPTVGANHSTFLALFISSVAFSLVHLGNDGVNIVGLINIVLIGFFFGIYVIATDNLWGACAVHGIWNFLQGNFYGVKVSGMTMSDSIFNADSISGKEFINGGDFGAEGGIASTIIIAISLVCLIVYMNVKNKNDNNTNEVVDSTDNMDTAEE